MPESISQKMILYIIASAILGMFLIIVYQSRFGAIVGCTGASGSSSFVDHMPRPMPPRR